MKKTKEESAIKDFLNDDDVKSSDAMTKDNSDVIKFQKDEKAPIYLLKSQYVDGYAHWVQTSSGDNVRVPCCGGFAGNGRAPDECPICKYVASLYKEASQSSGRQSEELREKASKMRGNYEIYFIAAKGAVNVVKIEGNKRKTAVEFDNAQVGVLRLSKAQYTTLRGIPTKYNYITSMKDLFNRYIIVDKQVRGEDNYASIELIPAEKPTKRPDAEIPEDLDISNYFDIDVDAAKAVLALHLSEDDDDEGVDYENDEEETVSVSKKNVAKKPVSVGKSKRAVVEADDDDDEDDLEDFLDDAEVDASDDDAEVLVDDDDDATSEFDDDFLDDVDDDFDEDADSEEEEEPAIPKRASKAIPAKSKKPVEEVKKPSRGRPAKVAEEVKKPSRGRPAKVVEEVPVKKRGRPASVPEVKTGKKSRKMDM